MPLSPSAPRKPIHTRTIECKGYLREDGMWDIEAQLVDSKAYDFSNEWRGEMAAGTPVHDMWLRFTVDDKYLIHGVEAVSDSTPYNICPEITQDFQKLVGLSIVRGFKRKMTELLGGTKGCTHLAEMAGRLATVAFQTIRPHLKDPEGTRDPTIPKPGIKPVVLNTCHAWDEQGEVVKRWLPDFYTGPQ